MQERNYDSKLNLINNSIEPWNNSKIELYNRQLNRERKKYLEEYLKEISDKGKTLSLERK